METRQAFLFVVAVLVIAYYSGYFGTLLGPSAPPADFGTPTAGCLRACCNNSGRDCVEARAPCKDRTDGRTAMKRFLADGDSCPNSGGTGGWVAPPESYRQYEARYCDNNNPLQAEGAVCNW